MKRIRFLLVAALVAGAAALPAQSPRRFGLDELARKADGVFVGVVSTVGAHDSASGATRWSDYGVEIRDVLAGEFPSGLLTLSFADGGPDGSGGGVAGMPKLRVGQSYLFFRDAGLYRACPALGWQQGIFVAAVDPLLGEGERVLVSLDGEPLWVDAGGEVRRGARVVLDGERVVGLAPALRDAALRLPEPAPLPGSESAQGMPAATRAQVAGPRLVRPATLDDLRLLLRRVGQERRP